MCNKYWNAGYDELLEMSSLPSLSDRRFTLPSVLCSEVVLLPAVFFWSLRETNYIFSTDLTCSLNHLPVLTGYKCICMTSSVMPGTLGFVNVSCMRYIASKKFTSQSSYVILHASDL